MIFACRQPEAHLHLRARAVRDAQLVLARAMWISRKQEFIHGSASSSFSVHPSAGHRASRESDSPKLILEDAAAAHRDRPP